MEGTNITVSEMIENFPSLNPYWDKRTYATFEEWEKVSSESRTIYIGNLPFTLSESEVWSAMELVGPVTKVTLGVSSYKRTPCGFAFVEFATSALKQRALQYLNGIKIGGNYIRCDRDSGEKVEYDARRLGRGKFGNQTRFDL